ncbi:MAG: phage tail sheath subtilisin-like domain-containing protein, partial [Thermoanaerobaculia bacterium]
MAVQVTYPGVYVQEVSSGVRTITGVATSIAMFVGRTERGIMDKPTRLFSFSDYQRKFGAGTQESEMTHQVRQFFLNGGSQAYVVRIADNAAEAGVELNNGDGDTVLEVTAKEAGSSGDRLRIEIDYDTPQPDQTFNLRVFRFIDDGAGGFLEEDQEVFQNLTMDPAQGRYAPDVVSQGSALIELDEPQPAVVNPLPGLAIAGRVLGTADPDGEVAALIAGGQDTLRISLNGDPAETFDLSTDTTVTEIQTRISSQFAGATVTLETIGAGPASRNLLLISSAAAEDVVVEATGNAASDFGAAMQLGADRGGLDFGTHGMRRPAQSGLFFHYGSNFDNLGDFATSQQDSLDSLTIDGAAIASLDLETTASGDLMLEGLVTPAFDSLTNVREKLQQLVQQFNDQALATPDFDWRLTLQGIRLVLEASAGDANAGFSTTIVSATDTGLGTSLEPDNVRYYSLGAGGAGTFQANGAGGDDGDKPILGDYQAAFEVIDSEVDLFNLLMLPRDAEEVGEERADVWGAASVFAQQRRAFLVVDPPRAWEDVSDVTTGTPINIGTLRQGLVKDHAAVFWPRLTVVDPATGLKVNVDPSGSIAGVAARTDGNRGVWKAPAGIEADVRGVRGLERTISDPENGVVNPQAVNALRVFPNGIVVWGSRTMDGFDNSGNDDYKYVPVRRLTLFIEESLYRGLKFAVFEPNDEPLWAQIRLAAGAFMNNLFRQGAFQGQKKSDAYFVKCDSETTIQN